MSMKIRGKKGLAFRILVVGTLCLLIAATAVLAASNGLSLPWWTADGGGGASAGGEYALQGTIGQADAGAMSGADYTLSGGFWISGEESLLEYNVYLPAVTQ